MLVINNTISNLILLGIYMFNVHNKTVDVIPMSLLVTLSIFSEFTHSTFMVSFISMLSVVVLKSIEITGNIDRKCVNQELLPVTLNNDLSWLVLRISCNSTNIYLFKVNNGNAIKRCETCSRLRIKIPEPREGCHADVFIVDSEHISYLFLELLLLTLNN